MTAARSQGARRARIRALLLAHPIGSQAALRSALASEGITVTQATLSRDLDALGAVKEHGDNGSVRYTVPDDAIARIVPTGDPVGRIAAEVLLAAEAAQNLAVLRTPPGAAMYLAGALDRAGALGEMAIVGTVAGDDTVMVVLRTADDAQALCRRLLGLAERKTS